MSPDWANELAVFHSLRAQALGAATLPLQRRYSAFDSDDMAFTPHLLTIEARTKVDTPGGSVDGWRVRTRDEKQGEEVVELRDDTGLPLRAEIGAVTVVIEGSPGGDGGTLEVDSMIPVEGRVDAQAPSARLEVTVKGDASSSDPIFSPTPYQAVERAGDVYTLTLSPRRRATGVAAPALPMSGLPSDVSRFLEPTARSQSTQADIVKQSQAIVAGEKDSDKAARKIVRWVFQKLDKRDGARGAASAVETLKAKAGDCTEHTALTIALARAAGIPARAAGGIVLIPGFKSQAGYHAWPELWLGDWVVMDPALGDLDTGPRYILLGYDEPGEARGEAKLVRLLGRTKIRMK
ncbi:MAG: transglutaminase domain-containing protein [Myxococcales bacterium]|nr:transglutaminase domain-containing protein [Myxococcales bacterium]